MTMKDMTLEEDIKKAVACLKQGGIILYPTDTIWGIGCDASNDDAIRKIFELKKREDSKSMLVLVGNENMLESTVENIPSAAWQLIEASVMPLTIIYDYPKRVSQLLKANDGSLGVRITKEKFSKELCLQLKNPVVSTSANISGMQSPINFRDISPEIIAGVDYVVTYRRNEIIDSCPSNIIKVSEGGVVKVIR